MITSNEVDRYTDHYFINSRIACERAGNNRRVTYQVFQRNDAVLCGMRYVMPLLNQTSGAIEVYGLEDGDLIAPKEAVMHITGPITELIELETVYLGLLARMTRIATNVRSAVEAARGKLVLFFPARFDVPEVQEYDGYAAKVGGAFGASTKAGAQAFGRVAVGTMPHAMIAAFKGDTVAAALAMKEALPNEDVWALVDFNNDSASTSVAVHRAFQQKGWKLAGIRLDTSQDLVDVSLEDKGINEHGVTVELAREVRRRLDEAGGHGVKISVSGGFTPEKVAAFEAQSAPVDVYAIGERFLRGSNPFTSDIVGYYEGDNFVPCSKLGRQYTNNPRLRRLK